MLVLRIRRSLRGFGLYFSWRIVPQDGNGPLLDQCPTLSRMQHSSDDLFVSIESLREKL
jgi:hypothetical protein